MAISAAAATTLSLSTTSRRNPISSFSYSRRSLASSSSLFFTDSTTRISRAGFGLVSKARTDGSKRGLSCNCLFGLGVPELAVIAGVTVLLFGPKKLPEVGRTFGKTIKSFQQAAKEFETELRKEPEAGVEATIAETGEEKQTNLAVGEEEKQDVTVSSSKEI